MNYDYKIIIRQANPFPSTDKINRFAVVARNTEVRQASNIHAFCDIVNTHEGDLVGGWLVGWLLWWLVRHGSRIKFIAILFSSSVSVEEEWGNASETHTPRIRTELPQ